MAKADLTPCPVFYPLLENGLDFLVSAVDHLGRSSPRDLKYAVVHLAAGVQLVLKERLRQHDPAQLYAKPDDFDERDYRAGDFDGVKPKDLLQRLTELAKLDITPTHADLLDRLRIKRNAIEHFHVADTAASATAVTSAALQFTLEFIDRELSDGHLTTAASTMLDEIRGALPHLAHFVTQRWKAIDDQLLDVEPVVECWHCGQHACVLDAGAHCAFCLAHTKPAEAADDYAHLVLGESHYRTVKDGGDWIVSTCPECDVDSLVDQGPSGSQQPVPDQWVCFNCGETYPERSLTRCDHCGTLISNAEGEMTICSGCFDAMVERN
jgi:hypothetical protein